MVKAPPVYSPSQQYQTGRSKKLDQNLPQMATESVSDNLMSAESSSANTDCPVKSINKISVSQNLYTNPQVSTAAIAVVAPTTRNVNSVSGTSILATVKQTTPGQSHPMQPINLQSNITHASRIPHQYHHIQFPVPPPGGGAWPVVEPVFHFGPGFEPQTRHYCPTHSQGPQPPEHIVLFHVNPGVSVTFQMAGSCEVVRGPSIVPMVSQSGTPPMAMPVQVPPGHVMQQIVDENGTLRHVILSTAQHQQIQSGTGVQNMQPHLHYINGTTPHFYQPVAANFPGPAPHFHTMTSGHIPHQNIPPPSQHTQPSIANSYHKDERSQRQHTKLLRKLDQKQRECPNSALSTPAHSPSPRKTLDINGLLRVQKNGSSSVGTSEDGEESSSAPDDEDENQTLRDLLSEIAPPEIMEITPRSALVHWYPPQIPPPNSREICYEVLLNDTNKEGQYKKIFKGTSKSCRIQDLKPAQKYAVCLQAYIDDLNGSASGPSIFSTPACEPDQPQIPKLVNRSKNTLVLRWLAPSDNGGSILNYIIEYDEGSGKEFVEVVKTKAKQYSLSKLQPSTTYNFRIAAVNDHGKSQYSEEFAFSTQGNPPQPPLPPNLEHTTSSSLLLVWNSRPTDEEFTLQMNDKHSGHGFLPVYNGRDTSYDCVGLRRATIFYFRLKADNENGSSLWSNEVSFKTLPEAPGRPLKPQVKGKIHSNSVKIKWEPPADRGGADIQLYHLEIRLDGDFERIYSGSDTETVCDKLQPGTTYQFRLLCEGPGGSSTFSEVLAVLTEAVVPGAPDPPVCSNPPGPFAAVLRWDTPNYNGGAAVIEYEVEVIGGIPKINRLVYKGKEKFCVANNLIPGEHYKVQVRALNRIGAGAWSNEYIFKSGATAPNVPENLYAAVKTPTQISVSWYAPTCNGAEITEYRLEEAALNSDDSFHIVYQGICLSTEIRNLTPFSTFYFRVCASNSAGTSPFSDAISVKTPAAAPNPPVIDSYEISSSDALLLWNEPENNGSEILYYNIEYSDQLISTETNKNEFMVTNLTPETNYKIKIQAVNEIGAGAFSTPIKITTLPLPPIPPKLECYGVGSNFLKLKWGEKNAKNLDFKRYYLEMFNNRCKEFQRVYSGTNFTFKANKLQEMTSYIFRISVETDHAGMGDYSEEYVFKTCPAQPTNIKAPRLVENSNVSHDVEELNSNTSITIEWQHSKNSFSDTIEYMLHMSTSHEEFKEIYRGPDTKFTICNLCPGVEYQMKVCPVRILSNSENLLGIFSPILRYSLNNEPTFTIGNDTTNLTQTCNVTNGGAVKHFFGKLSTIYRSRDTWTDHEKAIFLSIFFLLITVIFAAIVKHFIR